MMTSMRVKDMERGKRKNLTRGRIWFAAMIVCCGILMLSIQAQAVDQSVYPHWDLEDEEVTAVLEKLETFIRENAKQDNVILFDWDGTLYNEKVAVKEHKGNLRSGQSAWHLWAGANLKKYRFLFPHYRLETPELSQKYLYYHDDYLEGKNQEKPQNYGKFRQIACIEAGMTVKDMERGIRLFLKEPEYLITEHMFTPVFDILQRFADNGYIIYIVTGSNQYYVRTVLGEIKKQIPYTTKRAYDFGIISKGNFRIMGNAAKVGKNKRFTAIYDDTFVMNQGNESYVGNKEGKAIAIERYLEGTQGLKKPIFIAGNSGGDCAMIKYCVKQNDFPNTWGLSVDPRGDLVDVSKDYDLGVVDSEKW